jgi:pSer/pThr/pTyr-binding forkhead associated (FHA) protein
MGILWRDLVGVLCSIPKKNFLAASPAPFLLELPESESLKHLPMLSKSVAERRAFVEKRLKILAAEDLSGARVHYLASGGKGQRLTVGRKSGVDVILDSQTVSKQHAELQPGRRGWRLTDLDAANGTFIEERRLPAGRTLPLTSGMVVKFSEYRAVYLGPEDLYDLLVSGERVSLGVREILSPVPEGRRLRDVVAVLGDEDTKSLVCASAFLMQVPTEAEDVLEEDLSENAGGSMTQEISRTRIMRLQRSRKVGDARVHVIAPTRAGICVGRSTGEADLVLPEQSVSKLHARILYDGTWGIVDLDTRNGTFLEKRRLEPGVRHPLKPGQGVFFSSYRALFLEFPHLLQLVSKVKSSM